MNSLRIERVNRHCSPEFSFPFLLFAYCTLFSYVFFLRLARIRADQYEFLPPEMPAHCCDYTTSAGCLFRLSVFIATMGECADDLSMLPPTNETNSTGLSLWLVPTAEQSAKLSWIMHIRPPTAKMPNSYPRFHPHITLATVPSTTPVGELIAAIPPRQLRVRADFSDVVVSDAYFRSVLAVIKTSPETLSLHAKINENLKIRNPQAPMFPHMSIYYIDDAEAEERFRVLQELRDNGTVVQTQDGVQIHTSGGPAGIPTGTDARPLPQDDVLQGFDGVEIWAALCDGPVETWTVLKKVELL